MPLSSEELALTEGLANKLSQHVISNNTANGFYTGSHVADNYQISMPPKLQCFKATLGWGAIVVDTLESRLSLIGYEGPYDLGLRTIFEDNFLQTESSMVHHDALLYGTGFVMVGTGYDGEPNPLITVASPLTTTGIWDARTRRLSAALSIEGDTANLYLPMQTLTLARDKSKWVLVERDEHGLGRVPVVRFDNRMRTTGHGQSEITEAVRYLVDAAARTALRGELTAELYAAPKMVVLGGDQELFMDDNGNPVSQWTAAMGRVQQIPWDPKEESKTNPNVTQLSPADPKPFIDQIHLYAEQLASVAGLPVSYFGVSTNYPTSGDAIKAGESRLIKKAENRQAAFSRGWMEVARLALLIRDHSIPAEISNIHPLWMDPSTPTRAATTDALVKLVAAQIIPADSSIVADELGLTTAQRTTLELERTKARAQSMVNALVPNAPIA